MAARVSADKRVKLQSVSEREIMRYAGDHAMWHKHIHNVELDAVQILKMESMDANPNTLDFSCRRTGKTAVKEMYFVEHNACNGDQELGIVAPREAQSLVNLGYHTDAIRRSEILSNFLAYKSGRKQLSDSSYEFANRSKASAYGIMSQIDGSDLTAASLEEVDDMPPERLYSRFLLTMGATRRLGASKAAKNDPQIRITGVFKGADTLSEMVDSGKYMILPTVDCHLGIELGILNEQFILDMRDQLAPEEYIRQLLCRNVAAKNLIWEKWIRLALHRGVAARLEICEPVPFAKYRKRGLISFGYDHSGHGENPAASRSALVVGEQLGNFTVPVFCKTWPAGTDDNIVKKDLLGYWRYFNPDFALGDAFGVGMMTSLNDELFGESLTEIDRRAIGGGDSTASTWPEWAFSPIRFEGMVKHQMAQAVRSVFHHGQMAMPYIDDLPDSEPAVVDMRLFQMQLTNIRPSETKATYSSYKMVKRSIGDDLFDACMAMVWGFVTQGAAAVPTVVSSLSQSRAQLLGTNQSFALIGETR